MSPAAAIRPAEAARSPYITAFTYLLSPNFFRNWDTMMITITDGVIRPKVASTAPGIPAM